MSFCSSPERKTTFLPGSGFGALVGPSQVVWGPANFSTAALASETASANAGVIHDDPAEAAARTANSAERQMFVDMVSSSLIASGLPIRGRLPETVADFWRQSPELPK